MRILGIDYGDSRIGVAVSDEGSRLAFGVCVVDASKGRKPVSYTHLAFVKRPVADCAERNAASDIAVFFRQA